MHKSLHVSRHKDAEILRKIGISIFCLFVLLIFDHQDGWPIFQREVTIAWVGTINYTANRMSIQVSPQVTAQNFCAELISRISEIYRMFFTVLLAFLCCFDEHFRWNEDSPPSLHAALFFIIFSRLVIFFFKINFFNILSGIPSVSKCLDPDQAWHLVRPDLGLNCLQRLSADDASRKRVKG